jgi:VWFA-related protein
VPGASSPDVYPICEPHRREEIVTSRRFRTTVLLLALALSLGPVAGIRAQTGVRQASITLVDPSAFPRVDVYFSAQDLDGEPILGLDPSAVAFYENEVPVSDFTLEETEHPMLIGVVIDSAVSFNTVEGGAPRVEKAKEAARWLIGPEFGRLILDDEVAVYAFQEGTPQRLIDFTYDHQQVLDEGLARVSTAGNRYTALFDLLRRAVEETAARPGARRRALLVFSDGVDKTSGVEVDRVIGEAVRAHLLIYTVGMGSNLAHDQPGSAFLRRLAEETGGRYMWYRPGRAGAAEEMQAFLDGLVAQRRGYHLTYTSSQYQGTPTLRLVVSWGGYKAEDTASYTVPPLPPRVSIEGLEEGQILEGVVTVRPGISMAQREIERVEFWVDDGLRYTARAAPWTWEWDTRPDGHSTTGADAHLLRVVACDLGGLCGEATLPVGVRLPMPTPTPTPVVSPTVRLQTTISLIALAVAVGALILAIVLFRRGGMQAVRNVAAEVRRRTRVWRQRTGLFGGGVPAARHGLATLTVLSGPFADRQFVMEEDVVFLGREEERADIVFYWDDYVSRRHAKIAREGDQFYIWDLNSANGTWVDEQRVPRSLSEGVELSEAVPLRDGAVIRLGPDLRLRFQTAGAAEGAAEATPKAPAPAAAPEAPAPAESSEPPAPRRKPRSGTRPLRPAPERDTQPVPNPQE